MERLQQFVNSLTSIGCDPADSEELRLKKRLLVGSTIAGMLILFFVGIVFIVIDARIPAILYETYAALNLVFLALFGTRRLAYRPFVMLQLALVQLVPLFTALSLGGIRDTGGTLYYGFLAPLAALLFFGPGPALAFFGTFVGTIIINAAASAIGLTSTFLSSTMHLVLVAVNTSALGMFVLAIVMFFVVQRNRAFAMLKAEERKSDALLLNILPARIAASLKDGDRTVAQYHAEASILFADVADFTPLSATLTPTRVVEMLNEVFTAFDHMVDRRGLEKIKTIGDCYMVAAGVPEPRADHAEVIAELAAEMMKLVRARTFQGCILNFRIGINSGPVVAGVIGEKKFVYDLWGDTVNIASRMQESGIPGEIQLTEATCARLGDDFTCEPRGEIEVKGKGLMPTYLLRAHRRPVPEVPAAVAVSAPDPASVLMELTGGTRRSGE